MQRIRIGRKPMKREFPLDGLPLDLRDPDLRAKQLLDTERKPASARRLSRPR